MRVGADLDSDARAGHPLVAHGFCQKAAYVSHAAHEHLGVLKVLSLLCLQVLKFQNSWWTTR